MTLTRYQYQLRRGTAAEWIAKNPILSDGELGFEKDTRYVKVGDGTTPWTQLPYANDALGVTTLTDASTIGMTLGRSRTYAVTINGNRQFDIVGGVRELDGKAFVIEITQGAGGNHTVNWSSDFLFSTDLPSITLSTTPGATDCIGCDFRYGIGVRVLGFTRGF